ncbi:MAG: hypothetical protein ACTHLA_02115 [Asticcacaulis sp.]|uniref:hypothetical protein n=1 Tax=Asticcacaulis sp. TaxID=1872648 RepID=UPI003F7C5D6B
MPATSRLYIGSIAVLLLLTAGLAIAFGYISVDSWYYMLLAQGLRDGHPLQLHGQYMAVYPLGYPALLALTAPLARPEVMMITAKLVNIALLGADAWLIWRASGHVLMATLVAINPVSLVIAMYSWSENLELFAICASLYLIIRLSEASNRLQLVLLAGALIVGVFARYFFSPFAFLLFIAVLVVFGRKVAWRVFPAFCAAGAVYLAYQGINWAVTGYATGMPRHPAPEASLLLIREFLAAVGWNGLKIAIAAGLLVGIARLGAGAELAGADFGRTRKASALVLGAGLAFLGLAFALRMRTYFDPFNTRTIGYGLVLVAAALVGRWTPAQPGRFALTALLACGLFSVVFADDFAIPQDIHDLITDPGDYSLPAASLATLRGPAPDADVVVSFQLPVTGLDFGNVDNVPEVWYGPDVKTLAPFGAPDNPPESAAAFEARLAALHPKACKVDFTPFAMPSDFDAYLNARYLIDRRWSFRDLRFHKVKIDVLSPDVRAVLQRGFVAGRLRPCAQVFPPRR